MTAISNAACSVPDKRLRKLMQTNERRIDRGLAKARHADVDAYERYRAAQERKVVAYARDAIESSFLRRPSPREHGWQEKKCGGKQNACSTCGPRCGGMSDSV